MRENFLNSIVRGIVQIIDETIFLPSLKGIDDGLAKFISLVVQLCLPVLAIADSFGKLCLTDCYRKSCCVTRTRRVRNQNK